MTTIRVEVEWNQAANAWHVCRSELSGLDGQAPTLDDLMQRVVSDVPGLLARDATPYDGQDITVQFVTDVLVKNPLLGG